MREGVTIATFATLHRRDDVDLQGRARVLALLCWRLALVAGELSAGRPGLDDYAAAMRRIGGHHLLE